MALDGTDQGRIAHYCYNLVSRVYKAHQAPSTTSNYESHFRIVEMACKPLGLDPLNLSIKDWMYVLLFFTMSRSVNSIDSFLSSCAFIYESHGCSLPKGVPLDRFKKALKRLFLAADVPRPAWAMPLEVFFAMLRCLDRSRPRDVVTGAWLFIAFLFALRPEDLAHGRLQWRDIVFLEDGGVDVVVRPGKGKGVRGSTPFSAGPAIDQRLSLRSWLMLIHSLLPPNMRGPKHPVFVHLTQGRYFGWQISTRWLVLRIRELYARTFNKPHPERLSAYSLRRGGATAYYNADIKDIHLQHLLRHKSLETSQLYVDSMGLRGPRRSLTDNIIRGASSFQFPS